VIPALEERKRGRRSTGKKGNQATPLLVKKRLVKIPPFGKKAATTLGKRSGASSVREKKEEGRNTWRGKEGCEPDSVSRRRSSPSPRPTKKKPPKKKKKDEGRLLRIIGGGEKRIGCPWEKKKKVFWQKKADRIVLWPRGRGDRYNGRKTLRRLTVRGKRETGALRGRRGEIRTS